MKYISYLILFVSLPTLASVVGISAHPLSDEGRVLSAEMTGFMSGRNEMGIGARYTQEVDQYQILDVAVSGGQESRGTSIGSGMDFEILSEDISQPRVSLKPFVQFQKFDNDSSTVIGAAPTLRKGFSINRQEVFPYIAIPSGMKIDSKSDEFVYQASLTLGASMPFPGANNDKVLLSFEGNKNMGASSDYLGLLVSWVWK